MFECKGLLINEQSLSFHEKDRRIELLPPLNGRVFQLTTLSAYSSIQADGAIKPNTNGDFKFSWNGDSENSYFRKGGCISVFDLRTVTAKELEDALSKFPLLNPPYTANKPVYLFLNPICFERLLPWTEWKKNEAYKEMILPYVEAGFPGDIRLDLIDTVLRVEVDITDRDNQLIQGENVAEAIRLANERLKANREKQAREEH